MKPSLLASVLALSFVVGCQSGGKDMNNHWNNSSTVPRASRFFLGYDAEKDGSYRDFAWERKQDINLTLRRYFLNHNPDNPYQPEWPSQYEPRPVNSLLPNPTYYIHLEGLLLGFITLGAGGPYIPLPIDSILGTFEDATADGEMSGKDEFMVGVNEAFGGSFGTVTATFAHKWIEPAIAGPITRVHRIVD